MPNFPERVAARAEEVRVVRILLTVLVIPFYLLGAFAGLLWLAIRWLFAAVMIGFSDVAKRGGVSDDAG